MLPARFSGGVGALCGVVSCLRVCCGICWAAGLGMRPQHACHPQNRVGQCTPCGVLVVGWGRVRVGCVHLPHLHHPPHLPTTPPTPPAPANPPDPPDPPTPTPPIYPGNPLTQPAPPAACPTHYPATATPPTTPPYRALPHLTPPTQPIAPPTNLTNYPTCHPTHTHNNTYLAPHPPHLPH